MLAFSEGVVLAQRSGISREVAVDIFTHSVVASPMVGSRGPFVLKLPDGCVVRREHDAEDMLLALEMGRRLDVPLGTTGETNEFLTAARGMGITKEDFAVVLRGCWSRCWRCRAAAHVTGSYTYARPGNRIDALSLPEATSA